MKFVKLLGGVAVLSTLLSGCVVDGGGGLLDASVGVRVPVGGHHDNGRHEGERREHHRHGDDD